MKSAEPNVATSNKNGGMKPPYPVDETVMINEPPAPDPDTTDLVTAVQYGYYSRVVELIEPEPALATRPLNGNITLLHWAAINNRIRIAEYLISKRAQIDAFGGELNSTPLQWAVRDGKISMVVFLLSHQAQASLFDGEGFAPIHIASMFGYTDIVAYLIAKGQDIDFLDKTGMTPLMHAVSKLRNRDPAQLLVRLGAQVNYQNPINQSTALHYAIAGSNLEAIRILLDAGAKTDIRNADNETPYDLVTQRPNNRHLLSILSSHRFSNDKKLPKLLQFTHSNRRLGTKCLPYMIIILIAYIFQLNSPLIAKSVLLIALFFLTKGYMMIFFDNNVDRYLPISIAQASILWLYVCYIYYFLQYIHLVSFNFLGLVISTYFSWTNYYFSQKCDPGVIVTNQDQQYRTIIQLVEEHLFDYEHFCTCCLIRRPMRSKHCRECQRCIAKFDHHCPWIDNCVGEKNLRYFVGFLFFTPLCLCFYLYGAYLYYRDHCHLFASDTVSDGLLQLFQCSPAVLWFTSIAILHTIWVSSLCGTILYQVITGYTTNEKMNSWRYHYLQSKFVNPFSLGYIQNLVDLINRSILWYNPINIDWSRIYSVEDFYQSIPIRTRQRLKLLTLHNSTMESLIV